MAYLNNTGVETLAADIKSYSDNTYISKSSSIVSSVNNKNGTVVLDADDVGAMSNWDLLWTNASPDSAFAAQTISLELSDYNAVLVDCISYREEPAHVNAICLKGFTTRINRIQPYDSSSRLFGVMRDAVVSTTGVQFDDAMQASVSANGITQTNALIPYRIFGIKGVITT